MKIRSRIRVLLFALPLVGTLPLDGADPVTTFPWPRPLPEATPAALPRWRGFNLQYKFHRDWANTPIPATPDNVAELDFRMIAELGFNFVRLPLDYRIWISNGNWEQFNESALVEIDRLVALGEKYGLHVCLAFHRAPGYTVNTPAEATSLWTDANTQRVCALHWATFARRYRGIASRQLSFNLFNEPAGVEVDTHFAVVRMMAEAIHAEDPDRLVLADGLEFGRDPDVRMRDIGVGQCTRGYGPFGLTHYRAEWVDGADAWPEPEWPGPLIAGFFAGPDKADLQTDLVLNGPLGGNAVRVRVGQVSRLGRMVVTSDDGTVRWDRTWTPSANDPEAAEIIYVAQWSIYQNIYNRDYTFAVPAGVTSLTFRNTEGDWMMVTRLHIEGPGGTWEVPTLPDWGLVQDGPVTFDPSNVAAPLRARRNHNRTWLWTDWARYWSRLPRRGVGVMVGEMGAYRHTPHPVMMRWLEDQLEICQRAKFGWALWEFRGGFGPLDSDRSDVTYESWNGHQVDRAMLELLQRY